MQVRRKNFDGSFARASLGFVLTLVVFHPAITSARAAGATASVKRQSASAQFAKAEEQRAALNSKPTEKRTLADYKQVVLTYRRVALITPHAAEVPDSLFAAGELYTEMGDRFGRSYYQSAVDFYLFLVREYPTNRNCQEATLRAAKLQRDQLGESELAKKSYEDFLKRYPRSPRKREAQEALAELALLQNSEATSTALKSEVNSPPRAAAVETRASAPVHFGGKSAGRAESGEIPRVRRIRASAEGENTRVTIDLEDSVQFSSKRITNPDRIYFDLHDAKLTPEAARGNVHVDGGLLTAVRAAQNHAGVVRVVLDVKGVQEYSALLASNPPRLLIDLYGAEVPAAPPVRTAKSEREQDAVGQNSNGNGGARADGEAGGAQVVAPRDSTINASSSPEQPALNPRNAIGGSVAAKDSAAMPKNTLPTRKNAHSKSIKGNAKPELVQPASAPQPTRDGQSTLTRTLGLKIGRIVIDPGHGGHDTGTIGPTGLMEKDLCLDVALRLGKIIQQRLPGAEVVYTRSDDTFIPLEDRTRIANEAKADLFISIHANSSQDRGARGIETYYLNLKGSAEAMEVAARENATAQEGVHDLQDLVKRIARTEKIDESKEFATDIQDSLAKRIQKSAKPVHNRGVRKAPFVVLIGADMPSILTEISFLSNPADEKLLKQPEQRQKVAEGLYQGVASYLQNMNSVTVNLPPRITSGRASATPAVEQSRNQR